jgi:hypothetical protein
VLSRNILTVFWEKHGKHLLFRYMTLYIEIECDIKEWENGTQKTKKQKTRTNKKATLNNRLKKHAKQNCHYNYLYFLCGIQLLKQENKYYSKF